jgi:hypothetical protein
LILDRSWDVFLFTTTSRLPLGPTQSLIKQVAGALNMRAKQLGHEADNSLPSSSNVKYAWSSTSIPPYVFMAWYLVLKIITYRMVSTYVHTRSTIL